MLKLTTRAIHYTRTDTSYRKALLLKVGVLIKNTVGNKELRNEFYNHERQSSLGRGKNEFKKSIVVSRE